MLSIDARLGTTSSRNAGEPNASIIQTAMLWIERNAATLGHPVASPSKMIVESRRPSPDPPSSSRTITPPMPSAAASFSVSSGRVFFASHSPANGANLLRANSSAISRIALCSSVSSAVIALVRLLPTAIVTPEEAVFVAPGVVRIEVDVHARDQRTTELEHAAKPSARRLSAAPFGALAVRAMGRAFDHHRIRPDDIFEVRDKMRDRLERPEQAGRQFAESGFARGDAEFREVDLHVIREELEHACVARISFNKVLLNGRQHGLLAIDGCMN